MPAFTRSFVRPASRTPNPAVPNTPKSLFQHTFTDVVAQLQRHPLERHSAHGSAITIAKNPKMYGQDSRVFVVYSENMNACWRMRAGSIPGIRDHVEAEEPNPSAFAVILRRCGNTRSLLEGKRIHQRLVECGRLDTDTLLGNLLVQMYGKCGCLTDAHAVFHRIVRRNVFSWTMILTAYIQNGHHRKALQVFGEMDIEPDMFLFASMLGVCSTLGALTEGKAIHARVVGLGIQPDIVVQNALINLYAKCGSIADARLVFHGMESKDVVSWTSMISAYAHNGHPGAAFGLFHRMLLDGSTKPNDLTFTSILAISSNLAQVRAVHTCISSSGFDSASIVPIALLGRYLKCGSLDDARRLFDGIHCSDAVSWTKLIAAYAQRGHCGEALHLYRKMDVEGVQPDMFTFATMLDACSSLGALSDGRKIHERMVASGFQLDVVVVTALLDMYACCGSLPEAKGVFDRMDYKDIGLWTAMIAAYAQHGHTGEAMKLFWQVNLEGLQPNERTFTSIIGACSSLEAVERGKHIHARIIAIGYESEAIVQSALINMYAKCGSLEDARSIFEKGNKKTGLPWTALITGYTQHGEYRAAIELYQCMGFKSVEPEVHTFVSVLCACMSLEDLAEGRRIHEHIARRGLDSNDIVGTALINMYAKCGKLQDAKAAFDRIRSRDVACWSAFIAAYAQHGHPEDAFGLFRMMELEGARPNEMTFTSILHACGHAGLWNQGRLYFMYLEEGYGITPVVEHYACMIDLLARTGQLKDAESLIHEAPSQIGAVAWRNLLGACTVHGDMVRGKSAAERVFYIQPEDGVPHILLSNIYAAAGSKKA